MIDYRVLKYLINEGITHEGILLTCNCNCGRKLSPEEIVKQYPFESRQTEKKVLEYLGISIFEFLKKVIEISNAIEAIKQDLKKTPSCYLVVSNPISIDMDLK